MARYNTASLVTMLRERTGLEREALLALSDLDDSSLRRIEDDKQHPKQKTLEMLMRTINVPLKGFVYPLLSDRSTADSILCDLLDQALDRCDIKIAEDYISQIDTLNGFDTGVYRQYKLSKKAHLWEMQDKSPEMIFPLIEEGLKETFYDLNDDEISKSVLVLEEPDLLHTKARLFIKTGEIEKAIQILSQMTLNLDRIPIADKEREKKYAPILLTLAKFLLKTGEYAKTLEICEQGLEYSAYYLHGRINPDFEFIMAAALHGLYKKAECRASLQHAYFGFLLLGEPEKAGEVLTRASEFNIEFNTFGVEDLDIQKQPRLPYNRGEPVECDSIGSLIRALRLKANLTLDQLCRGICNKSTLQRIEKGESSGKSYVLVPLLQRLGRDIYLYSNFFLSGEEFIATKLREKVEVTLAKQDLTEGTILLDELEAINSFMRYNTNKQFVKTMRAVIYEYEQKEPREEYPNMLIDAIKTTIPDFDEQNIEKYHLTFTEVLILNLYAGYLKDIDDLQRASAIYERIFLNLKEKCDDDVLKARMYTVILINYSTSLGRSDKRAKAMAIIELGERFDKSRGSLTILPDFIFNKGYNMCMTGKEKESIPYFALAYYGASMFAKHGKGVYLPIINNFMLDKYGFTFD